MNRKTDSEQMTVLNFLDCYAEEKWSSWVSRFAGKCQA